MSETNKSEWIRDYMEDNPDAKPKEVAQAATEAGLEVSPQYVSTIMSNHRRKTGGDPIYQQAILTEDRLEVGAKLVEACEGDFGEAHGILKFLENLRGKL